MSAARSILTCSIGIHLLIDARCLKPFLFGKWMTRVRPQTPGRQESGQIIGDPAGDYIYLEGNTIRAFAAADDASLLRLVRTLKGRISWVVPREDPLTFKRARAVGFVDRGESDNEHFRMVRNYDFDERPLEDLNSTGVISGVNVTRVRLDCEFPLDSYLESDRLSESSALWQLWAKPIAAQVAAEGRSTSAAVEARHVFPNCLTTPDMQIVYRGELGKEHLGVPHADWGPDVWRQIRRRVIACFQELRDAYAETSSQAPSAYALLDDPDALVDALMNQVSYYQIWVNMDDNPASTIALHGGRHLGREEYLDSEANPSFAKDGIKFHWSGLNSLRSGDAIVMDQQQNIVHVSYPLERGDAAAAAAARPARTVDFRFARVDDSYLRFVVTNLSQTLRAVEDKALLFLAVHGDGIILSDDQQRILRNLYAHHAYSNVVQFLSQIHR